MNHQLEAAALLVELSLPDGYRVREAEGRLYLFDPRGIPLHGPKDSSLIDAYAWRHAWRNIERELNQELVDLRSGVRPPHRLRRLRQYLRMLDAVAQAPREAEERPVRRRMVAWGTLAASAAAIVAVFLITPLRIAQIPERTAHSAASSQRGTAILAKHPADALPAKLRVSAKYAVSFGEFVTRTTADSMMHFIRSKGYIVYVARIGEDFRVVTRPYRTHAQARRLVNALQEIGLAAQLAIVSEI